MIRTLIVDDVELAREAIRLRLRETDDFQIVGEAGTGVEAQKLIRSLAPDLVFLDIEMPDLDGFELLDDLNFSELPHVIFVTAYDQHALRAFDVDALHFLLKPIDDDRFDEALHRVRREVSAHQEPQNNALQSAGPSRLAFRPLANDASHSSYWSRIIIKDRDRIILLKTAEVSWITSAANYVEIHSGARSFITRLSMAELERRLDPIRFARISRSIIVNIDLIRDIRPLWHGDFEVSLQDGTQLRMSRRYRDHLLSPQ